MKPIKIIVSFLFLLLTTAVVVLYILYSDLRQKCVYVDSGRLLSSYTAMKDAHLEFENKTAVWRTNLDSLRIELEGIIADFNASSQKLTPSRKQQMQSQIQARQEEYLRYEEAISKKMHDEDSELSGKVVEKINAYVKRFGKQHGYSIIMAATTSGNIIYADDQADITDEILEGLNAEYHANK